MELTRPLVFFDVETTGLSLSEDRIIEISMVKVFSDGKTEKYYAKINPSGRQISEGAYSKHGIKNEDLVGFPTFADIASDVYDFIKGCDLGGYNCKRFDIPLLLEEFLRVGIPVNVKEFKIVDVYRILTKAEPKTLESMYERFTGKKLESAHSAEADILATIELLDKMKEHFSFLPDSADKLYEYGFGDDDSFDLENKLKMKDNKIVFNFGKYRDKTIEEVYLIDRSYYDWLINTSDMTLYTKSIFKNIVKYLQNK